MMKNLFYSMLVCSVVLSSCTTPRTDLNKLNFNEPVSSLLYGAPTLNSLGAVTGLETLETNVMEHYSFDNILLTSGNSDTSSTISSNVRFHINADSTVRVVLLDLHRTKDGLAITDKLMKTLGKPLHSKLDPYTNADSIKIGYSGHYWESASTNRCYILQNSYYENADKTQGYDMMLYILKNDDKDMKIKVGAALLSF